MSSFWTSLLKPKAWLAKILLLLLLAGFVLLGFLGYLQPVQDFLESDALSFNLGETKLSVFLLIKAAFTVVVLFWLTGIVSEFGEKRITGIQVLDAGNKALVIKIFQILVYFTAFIVGLDVLGIDLTALAIFSGAVGIGIGFGLQKITSNFISGLILLFEGALEHGDLVELSDGTYGFIRHTGARYTLIETFEGKETMVPNEDFIVSRVTNWTYSNKRARVAINIGVSYESDIEKARELILESARMHSRCLDDPEPLCFLREFADSSVNFLLLFWVDNVAEGRYGPQSDVMRTIWKKFKEQGIAIPYPQRDLYIKNPEAINQKG